MTAKTVKDAVARRLQPAQRHGPVPPPPLPLDVFRTIVADPPWQYDQPGVTKADSRRFYPTLTVEEIASLPVARLADEDAHLWLWTTNALMEKAYGVVRAWGFSPLTLVTWCKPGPGVGHYVRNNTEHAILARRGRALTPAGKPLSSWYVWPRREHSRKPDEFFSLVEQVSPGPYLELFARRERPGWTPWGDEVAA